MSIEVRPIRVVINTNIPGKSEMPLTKSLLYNPALKSVGGLSEYPFFTMDLDYPEAYLLTLPYDKQVSFFFNRDEMIKTFRIINPEVFIQMDEAKQQPIIDKEVKKKKKSKRVKNNILCMLRVLFPTKYPFVNNISESITSVISGISGFSLSFSDFIPPFLKSHFSEGSAVYSYLKIDGKIYSVVQVVWLNDIYNNNQYGDLVKKLSELNKWKKKENEKLSEELDKKNEKFITKYMAQEREINSPKWKSSFFDVDTVINGPSDSLGTSKISSARTPGYRQNANEFDDILTRLEESIHNFFKELNSRRNINLISQYGKDISEFYEAILKNSQFKIWFQPKNKRDFEKFYKNLNRDIEDITTLEYIKENYLNQNGININYENEEKKYKDKLVEKYKKYIDFIESIKKFRSPNRESSNPDLQKIIDDFLDNTEKEPGRFNKVMNPSNIQIFDAFENSGVNTGVSLLLSAKETEPYFEINVDINLLGGELNDSNKSSIDCIYKGDILGDKLEYLFNQTLYNPWDVDSTKLFLDITKGELKEAIEKKEKPKETPKETPKELAKAEPKPLKTQGGGTRRLREYFMKTRKNYS